MSDKFNDIHHGDFCTEQTVTDESGVRRNPMMIENSPITCLDPKCQTLHELFMQGWEKSTNQPCLGWRESDSSPYSWLTYDEVLVQVKEFGSGLIQMGAKTNPDQFIGVFSQNRVEWKVTEQACNSYSMALVPLYDTLGRESIDHIVAHCELKIIVVDNNQKVKLLLDGVQLGKFTIDLLVVMKEPTKDLQDIADEHNIQLKTFEQIRSLGKDNLKEFVPPKPSDLHTICFTSGTTGMPKGAMLSHGNLVSNICGVYAIGRKDFVKVDENDVHISYLPLAHVFERVVSGMAYMAGARVGFFQGDIKLLLSDVGALKPSIFPMVPRLINRLYDKIHQGAAASRIKSILINCAKNSKLAKLQRGIVTRNSWWDYLVFRKVQNLFGGNARICITGAAPISGEVLNFMRCALGVNFTEGYGQTEATAAITVTVPNDFFSGGVGTPAICNQVKLVDVPEKEYFAKDGKGEICAKGTNVFQGYYKDPVKTAEALDEDGWLHTGDIGMWLPNGALKVIDRKKHIFKLAQGEYIAPEKIEQILGQSTPVAQIFLYGESLKATLVAVVVPDEETFVGWCKARGVSVDGKDVKELCTDEAVKGHILDDFKQLASKNDLKSFEMPKKIFLSPDLFTVENNMLTPTFKARRPQIAKHYEVQIQEMYSTLS